MTRARTARIDQETEEGSEAEQALARDVELARDGDAPALSRIIQATQDRLYRFSLYLTGNPARAQDLCQDTFLRAIEGLPKLKEASRFESWLLKTAKNLYLDYVK